MSLIFFPWEQQNRKFFQKIMPGQKDGFCISILLNINSEKLKSKYEINFFYWKHCGKKKLLPCNSCFFKLFFPFQEHCTKQAHIWNESSSPFIHTVSTQILRHCWLELHLTRFWPKDHFLGQILDYNSQNLNQTASKKPFCL